eukprot:snap_masked-scaffold_61-processed-gene-0.36-mRNA-1 protein AED:1.00 eAED:1.00 QI:0/-1/0/0/-1/1/1/0/265
MSKTMLSYKVFLSFYDAEKKSAEKMVSKDCFEKWVNTRKNKLKQPEESFRRVLTAHVCGLDGRKPFPEAVEKSLLVELRKRQVWSCFKGTKSTIGVRGFRNYGFHENKEQNLKILAEKKKNKKRKLVQKGDDVVSFYRENQVQTPPLREEKKLKSTNLNLNQDEIKSTSSKDSLEVMLKTQLSPFEEPKPESINFRSEPCLSFNALFELNKAYNSLVTKNLTFSGLDNLALVSSLELSVGVPWGSQNSSGNSNLLVSKFFKSLKK